MRRLLALTLCLFTGHALAANPVFDVHVHLRDGETSLQQYRDDVRAAGLQLSGIGVMWFGGPHQARQGDLDKIRAGNDRVIALATKHPDVLPIATVHPYDGDAALAELARVAAAGVKVLKIHAHTQGFDVSDPRVETLARRAGDLGVTVLMDNANILPGDSEKLFNLVVRVPKTKFILAHIGGLNFRFWNILALARTADGFGFENLYFDISATVLVVADSPVEEEFLWTLRNVGLDHVLLGSDYPQIGLDVTAKALDRLDLSDEEKAKIRSGNAMTLFGR
ncbi:amidohydrolase family protein [Pseudoxanthomonas sp. PXM01]|uniref:amidohydrolase family protein n=1 Tax=Pseudoxanthomonas sp. PXM01 TaxID=2769295 RepID=UPI00177B432B|nr:amidohydrolase family protein [Pseudoxanthomonas sp. PXM01]MBD9468000.1 amidohydrolase family protein [Pseudoxanthomonas sp. PXM01]